MAGFERQYQITGQTTGGLRVEAGDISYSEFSGTTQYVHIPTQLSHIVSGLAFPDGTVVDTLLGRASQRIGEISAGQICFSVSDVTIGAADRWTYIAIGW